jgi:hypothetical protein
MPIWLQNEGAWIAIGVSLVFVVAGWVMHRVFVRVLQSPPPTQTAAPTSTSTKATTQVPAAVPIGTANTESKP